MQKSSFGKPLAVAAILFTSTAAMTGPCIAQNPQDANTMLAQQPRAIGRAIAKWEVLQKSQLSSFADYAGFAMAYPDFPRMTVIRVRAENALDNEAPATADLIRYFDMHQPLTNAGRARYALALAGAQRAEAFDVAREAWRGGEMSGPAEAYLFSLFSSRFTPADHSARMDALLWQGDSEAAVRHMVNIAPAERGMAMERLGLLRGTIGTSPTGALSDPGYLYNYAGHLRSKRQYVQAANALINRTDFARLPRSSEDMVGRMLSIAKAVGARQAVQIATSADDIFDEGYDVSTGSFTLRDRYTDLMWLGGTKALWSLGDGASAAPLFYRYGAGAGTPLIRAKGFYWAGRAARQAGQRDEANRYYEMAAEYPEYYYGQLALQALGRSMPQFDPLPPIEVSQAQRTGFNSRPIVKAIRAIAANRVAWQTERRFFEALADSADTPEKMSMVADLAAETGLDEMAVVAGMTAGEHGLKGFERLGFPTITPPSGANWTMVHAISRQESEFDRFRVSHAGARGVMQLMPGTAREQAGKLGMNYMSANLINSPSYNMRLGDAYFARMMSYYGGAYPLAIGAYNAGPGRVNQWLRLNGDPRRGDIDWVTWVERIPANFETRYYIMRVLGNAVTYGHMYPQQAGAPQTINYYLR
ncbi:MAG: lytic transglycosylase domain-containing protein [Pseudomonadota bacterium]